MSKDRMNLKEVPQRFFGPTDSDAAERVIEMVLDDDTFREDLRLFAIGEIEMRELSYRIQVHMENAEKRMQEPDGIFGDSGVA